MDIIIDKPRIKDVNDIQDVFFKTWLSTYPNEKVGITAEDIKEKFKNRHFNETIRKRIEEIKNDYKDKIFLIVKNGRRIVGLCKASKNDKFNQLDAIYVLPKYQGKGIGRILWKRCLDFFDDDKNIIVHVAEYNTKAINFYKNVGFIDTGKRFLEEKFRMPISGKCIPEIEMIIKADKNK